MVRADASRLGRDPAGRDRGDPAPLVDASPGARRRPRQAERVAERMQMRPSHVQIAAVIALGAQHLRHLLAADWAAVVVAVMARQMLRMRHDAGRVRRLPAGFQVARRQVAIDPVALDQVLDQPVGGDGDVPDLARVLAPYSAFVFPHLGTRPNADLPAVSP